MFREIKMRMTDGSVQNIPFMATGSTPIRYRMLYHADLTKDLTKLINASGTELSEDADLIVLDRLAFLMNCHAEHKDMNALDPNAIVDWLDKFEAGEMLGHVNEIIAIYLGNKESTSEPKKENEPLTEK